MLSKDIDTVSCDVKLDAGHLPRIDQTHQVLVEFSVAHLATLAHIAPPEDQNGYVWSSQEGRTPSAVAHNFTHPLP